MGNKESKGVFMHGTLQVAIMEAKDLPDADQLMFLNNKNKSDPFVTLDADNDRLCKTRVIDDNLTPKWNEYFRIDIAQEVSTFTFRVSDKDLVGAESLGHAEISAESLMEGKKRVEGWLDLKSGGKNAGSLHVSIKFYFVDEASRSREIPRCYFSPSPDNKVTLYQDADTPDNELFSKISLAGGRQFQPRSAWRDMAEALNNAKHFIYMTGWSVDNNTTLVRDDQEPKETLGQLLIRKADEGVRVLLLIWDDRLSTDVTDGLGTHDNKTAGFFNSSKVRVALVPRQKRFATILDGQWASTCYSHHQKTITVDAEIPQENNNAGKRRIVTFVGGLDVTCGRWDNQQHALFASLKTTHAGDFYQTCFPVDAEHGPRQPWHDIHSKIEGPAAFDVLQNFVERWRRQVKDEEGDPDLVDSHVDDLDFDHPGPASDGEKWQVQILRTINSDSAKFVAEEKTEKRHFLFSLKGRQTEYSIHRGYVHHIRRAKRFIYIENQYFLGTSHHWLGDRHNKARHVIPFEIADAVCRKIAAGQRFAVYVVIPLFPEGDPSSGALQAILNAQYRTMQMMYERIGHALKKAGIKDMAPTDYLIFFCLGNREESVPSDLPEPPADSIAAKLRQTRRHQIYVHSKMMIVDDEVIIVGSANINQRSMAGNRDTEIAMCAFQPAHLHEDYGSELPRGDIYGLRMGLWAEHTGRLAPEYDDPSSVECARMLHGIGETNFGRFAGDEVKALDGHLMLYPLSVDQKGKVNTYQQYKNFPDTDAPVIGCKSSVVPLSVTT